jgi:hypothetical protein
VFDLLRSGRGARLLIACGGRAATALATPLRAACSSGRLTAVGAD